jgi:tetratricopeptide (TPR) repeat protein
MRNRTILIFWLAVFVLFGLACQNSPLDIFGSPDHRAQAEAAAEVGDYDLAITEFTQAIEQEPEDATLYYARGSAYYERYNTAYTANDPEADGEDFNRAITDFTQAIELDPRYAAAYNYRALAYAAFDMHGQALADYNMAIDLEPDEPTPYYGRGYLFEITGQIEMAVADYERFLELSDDPYWRAEAQKRLDGLQGQ